MEKITVYGYLKLDKIYTKDGVYQLRQDSGSCERFAGWYLLEKCENRWRLLHQVLNNLAQVYENWEE